METTQGVGRPSMKQPNSFPLYTVDSFCDGIAFDYHQVTKSGEARERSFLRGETAGEAPRLRSRYSMNRAGGFAELEEHLMRLSQRGILRSAQIVFGATSDPFFPFEGKFDASMKFLELFKRYTPGMLVIQTRSPLIVIAMPVLRALGKHAAVTMAVETNDDDMISRYTPGLPRFSDRIKAAAALRRFQVEVTLQVAPVLPYGDWRKDADRFAEQLVANSDYVFVRALSDGSAERERKLRSSEVALKLAQDRRFHWLRPDSAQPLYDAIERRDAAKLADPSRSHLGARQLEMFAA